MEVIFCTSTFVNIEFFGTQTDHFTTCFNKYLSVQVTFVALAIFTPTSSILNTPALQGGNKYSVNFKQGNQS